MEPHDINDREIEEFKDFDSLLKTFQSVKPSYEISTIKVISVGITVFLSLFLCFNLGNNRLSETIILQENIKENDSIGADIIEKIAIEIAPIDSRSHSPKVSSFDFKDTTFQVAAEKDLVKEDVYIQATPIDGFENLYAYFQREIIYPESADTIEGVLTVIFFIDIHGRPERITPSKNLGDPFEQEAIRLIENMPMWEPALLNGEPISSKLSLPITFQIKTKSLD